MAKEPKAIEPDMPEFEIAERRAKYGDLEMLRGIDADAMLVGQPCPMVTRWVNTSSAAPTGRFHKVVAQLGYKQVHERELITKPGMSGWGRSPEGYVVRGERGEEVLVKMPAEVYRRIQLRKAQDNERRRRSQMAMKSKVSEVLAEDGEHQAANVMASMTMTEFQETADVVPARAGS